MPKQGTRAEVNTFVKGLVTEASPLNFPADASQDEENFVLLRDGTRKRRLGFDYNTPLVLSDVGLGVNILNKGRNRFIWKTVEGDPNKDVLVIQFATSLYFYDLNSTSGGNGYINYLVLPFADTNVNYSMTSIEGKLVVVAGQPTVVIVSLMADIPSFREVTLKVRDFWGIAE